jgi:hypothetical protein
MSLTIADTPLTQPDLGQSFASGHPFPVVILDNFLPLQVADGLLGEIRAFQEFQKSHDYIFAKNKFESPRIENLGPHGAAIKDCLLSPQVADALSAMYGRKIFIDPDFLGGGLHRGGADSFLDMHTDFNLHPRNRRWIRELNLLLYLNKEWRPEYGGCLDLRNAHDGRTSAIEPKFNRLVIMLTKDFTLHGYRPINFPIGTFRVSIAAYAYSQAASDEDLTGLRTTTNWVPAGSGPLKSLVARFTPQLVALKQRLLGSATAKKKVRQE